MADLITWEDKENNPDLLAFLQQYGSREYLTAEEINLVRDAINYLNSKIIPINPLELRIVARGATNATGTDQPGDIVKGWASWNAATNSGVFWHEAIWNGGERNNRDNYTPLVITEVGN